MKTIHNSDIRFELNPRIIYVSDFEMTFYTVNKRDFSFRKTSADVQEVEVSGETKYYLDLDWSLLSYVGKGVLNYQCINNIADPSFPDGEYNQLVEKATDYYIDTFKVEPDSTDKSITELLGEEVEARIAGDAALSGAVDTEVDARIAADEAISGAVDTALSGKQDTLIAGDNITISGNVISATGGDLSNYYTKSEVDSALSGKADSDDVYTKSETSGKTEISTALDGKLDVTAYTPTDLSNYYKKSETSGATELTTAFASKLDTTAYTPTDLSNYYTKSETSGKTEIATALSAKADSTAVTQAIDQAVSGKADSSDVYLKSETSGKTEISTALATKLDTTAYTPTDLSNYYKKSETSGKTEIATALDGKSDTGHTHDERYYRKNETSGATELEAALDRKLDASAYTPTDLSNYYTKSETSGKSEIASAISDLSGAVDTALLGYVNNAAYVSTAKTINLLHGNTVIASVDATPFIKDGMVDNVVISGGSLVITFNTDSGKEAISIPLTDIFNPSNYYTKSDVDSALSGKADTTAVTEAINQAVSGKADSDDVYLKSETSGATELNTAFSAKLDATAYTPTDLSNYYTKSQTSGATEISTALSGKLDTTAYTPTDLSNYYTKSETSGATELATAFASKQGTLSAGTGIDITSNVISVTGGTGGGKAVSGGTNISITTGETADTINCTLPITAGTNSSGKGIIVGDSECSSKGQYSIAVGHNADAFGHYSFAMGSNSSAKGQQSMRFGDGKCANGDNSIALGYSCETNKLSQVAIGRNLTPINNYEISVGVCNKSVSASTTFGDSGNTLFSVGNGTDTNARHNAFEIRQNGDIYITLDGQDVKLQDNLGGGGSSINVVQTTGTSTSDVMSQDAVTTELSGKQDSLVSGTNIKTINGNSILGSGNITIQGGGGNNVVELTQAEYDSLVSKDPNVFYIITDATPIDLSNYFTSAQTVSAITEAVSGKVDSSDVYLKNETSGKTELDTAFAAKQGTLVSGTNIKTINNESILGSGNITIQGGGGKAIEAGRGITITTGVTADTVSFDLPISSGTGISSIIGNGIIGGSANKASSQFATAFGAGNIASGYASFAIGGSNYSSGQNSFAGGSSSIANETNSFAFGYAAKANGQYSIALGSYFPIANNAAEVAIGKANISRTGSTDADKTLFTVGNGTNQSNRHNAFEIRQNGDIYITSGGTDIKLQDNLGGGGSSVTVVQTTGTSTTDVMSQDAVTTALSGKADAADLGGLKLQQITQSAYDALTTKDASTLYVIVS